MIYADANAGIATTDAALQSYLQAAQFYGNPSSSHPAGLAARAVLEDARARVAAYFEVPPEHIIFTSGGTEADNLALWGRARWLAAQGQGPMRVLASKIEHPAVARALMALQKDGLAEVSWLPMDSSGRMPVETMTAADFEGFDLITCIAASNETGALQPVAEIAALLGEFRSPPLFHCDTVQAVGKLPKSHYLDADILCVSGHKFGAITGIGALVMRRPVQLSPLYGGGGQEMGLRSGTENVAGAISLATALEALPDRAPNEKLRNTFETQLLAALGNLPGQVSVVSANVPRLYNTSLVRFHGLEADALLMALDVRGVAVSTGSACSSGAIEPSEVLLGMGFDRKAAKECVRFSFLPEVSADEVEQIIAQVVAVVGLLRG